MGKAAAHLLRQTLRETVGSDQVGLQQDGAGRLRRLATATLAQRPEIPEAQSGTIITSTPKIKARARKESEGGRLLREHVHTRKQFCAAIAYFWVLLGGVQAVKVGVGGAGCGLRGCGDARHRLSARASAVGVGVATRIQTGCQPFAHINSVHPRLALRVLEDSRTFVATFQRSTVTRH